MKFFQRIRILYIEYRRDLRLAKTINQKYQQLLQSLGNKKEVLKESKELNNLL